MVCFLLADDVHHTLRDDDDFHHLLAVDVLSGTLVGHHAVLDGLVVGIGSKGHVEAGLTVESDAELDLALHKVLLVPLRPLGVADATLAAEHLPELLGDMGGEGGDEDDERLHHFAVLALLLRQLVDTDHEGGDGGVVRERLDVLAHLLD